MPLRSDFAIGLWIRHRIHAIVLAAGVCIFAGAATAAHAQVVEVCTVQPYAGPADDLKPGATSAGKPDGRPPARWALKCLPAASPRGAERSQSVSAKSGSSSQAADLLGAPFSLPTTPPTSLCDAQIPAVPQAVPLDANTLATLLNHDDYTIRAMGNYVLIVSRKPEPPHSEKGKEDQPAHGQKKGDQPRDLQELNHTIKLLIENVPASPPGFSIELAVPHAAALGSLANRIGNLNTMFLARPSGRDHVVVTTANGLPPACDEWKSFLRDVRELAWSIHPDTSETRLTALDAASMAAALGSAAAAPAHDSAGAAHEGTEPGHDGTEPPAGKAKGAPATSAAAVATPATPGIAVGSISPDLLIFSDANPGDDSLVTEKKRIAAMLDLPRAEMTISAWVMQNSSSDPASVNESSRLVRQEVHQYNDGLERTIFDGWHYLKTAMAQKSYFDLPFYNYISRRVILDGARSRDPKGVLHSPQQYAHDLLNGETARGEDLAGISADASQTSAGAQPVSRQEYLGACSQGEYCLGYATLFHPLRPRLTDLLLAMVAAADPVQQVECAVDHAEQAALASHACAPAAPQYQLPAADSCTSRTEPGSPCKVWEQLIPARSRKHKSLPVTTDPREITDQDCETLDYIGTLQSMLHKSAGGRYGRPILFLSCFRQTAKLLLRKPADGDDPVVPLGLVRSSVADFLFNYKMSQQYPHEFVPYDLTTSAQAMNTALRPLVNAFVQDVAAYQAVLKRQLGLEIEDMNKHLTAGSVFDKPRFFNNAIVTVNTIANSEASVSTATESYLEALNPPTLSGLASAVLGAPGTGSASTSRGTELSGLLSATRLNEAQAIASGLGQFQSSRVHIGRELSIDVRPNTLIGANSAELQVTLKADDEAASGAYSSGGTGDAEVSRFGKGDTSTRVRVDSLKLFEVSSFASQLEIPKKRFPLLPVPGLEMPYFGSILSFPVHPGREFHASLAVMSAIVIPTAADLAFTARFVADRLLVPEDSAHHIFEDTDEECVWPTDARDPSRAHRPQCKTRSMVSLHDFNGEPVREFNRMMTHCFATGGRSATPNLIPLTSTKGVDTCASLSFRDALADAE